MRKRLALNEHGEMTYCSSSEENIGKGRCNHIEHQSEFESSKQFLERTSKLSVDDMIKRRNAKRKQIRPGVTIGAVFSVLAIALGIAAHNTDYSNLSQYNPVPAIEKQAKDIFGQNKTSNEKYTSYNDSLDKYKDVNKNASYNKNGFTPDVQNLIDGVKVQNLKSVSYDRDEWSDYYKSYSYIDPTTNRQMSTESSNRAAYYNSVHYDKNKQEYHDPYTDKTFKEYKGTGANSVNFDHIIPLSYVARAGGQSWSKEKKTKFASDLTIGVDVESTSNLVKSDAGPSEWIPVNSHAATRYAYSWLEIANRYGISIAPEDMAVIKQHLKNADKNDLVPINQYSFNGQ